MADWGLIMVDAAGIAANKLAWEMESWASVEIRGREDFENPDFERRKESGAKSYHSELHYIETAAGQRLFERIMTPSPGTMVATSIDYSDGSKCAGLILRKEDGGVTSNQVIIKHHFAHENSGWNVRPEPFQFFYLGLEPLPKALVRATHLGKGQQLGRDCDRFLFPSFRSGGNQVYVYWLDVATGIPLRYESYWDQKAFAEERPGTVWRAESLDSVGGHHLALKSELIGYDSKGNDPHRVKSIHKYVMDEVFFDREYPKAIFWPKITTETTVWDHIQNTAQPPSKNAAAVVPTDPIRADDSRGSVFPLSTVMFILGSIVLASGLFLWWRRR
jgi:hypothetical protein